MMLLPALACLQWFRVSLTASLEGDSPGTSGAMLGASRDLGCLPKPGPRVRPFFPRLFVLRKEAGRLQAGFIGGLSESGFVDRCREAATVGRPRPARRAARGCICLVRFAVSL